MMESKEFLKSTLKKMFLDLENIEISYEYRLSSNTHIIEVKPDSIYRTCENYISREMELESIFYDKFPKETILFITEDSLTQIKSPDLALKFKMKYDVSSLYTPVLLKSFLAKNQLSSAGDNNYALAA